MTSRGTVLSTSEVQWASTKSDGVWAFSVSLIDIIDVNRAVIEGGIEVSLRPTVADATLLAALRVHASTGQGLAAICAEMAAHILSVGHPDEQHTNKKQTVHPTMLHGDTFYIRSGVRFLQSTQRI